MPNFVTPSGRRPRGLVKINGQVLTSGWIEFDIDNNGYYSADTFSLKLSGSALDAASQQQDNAADQCTIQMDTAWFMWQQDMYVELFIGEPQDPNNYGPADLTSWIYGQVDDIDYDPAENLIHLSGRDLTRLFIDTKTTQKWQNLTSSQIVAQLAQSHGMTAVIPVPTTTKAGDLYKIDHVNMNDDRSEWDLLNYLANAEGYVVFVRGTSLYFQPKPDPSTVAPYQLMFKPATTSAPASGNFERIRLRRALTVARGIQVVIRSWNKLHANGFTAKYPASAKRIAVGKSSIGAGAQVYSKTVPNISQKQANQLAQNWYAQLVAHEMNLDVEMPGDNSLDITSVMSLSGTKTKFDQNYFPDSIRRSMSFFGGYSMNVSAKNHSPDSQIGVL